MVRVVVHHQNAHGAATGSAGVAQGHAYVLHSGNIERRAQ